MAKLNYNKGRLAQKAFHQEQDSKFKQKIKRMKNNRATQAQIALMKKLGIEIPKNCSVAKASLLISGVLNKY